MARILKYGSQGSDVRELQQKLAQAGYPVAVDGEFGGETRAAVQKFQKDRGISIDGEVGGETLGAFAPKPRAKPDALPAYNAPVETAELPPLAPDDSAIAKALIANDGEGYGQPTSGGPGMFAAGGPDMSMETTDAEPMPDDGAGYGIAAGGPPMPGMAPPEPTSVGMNTDEASDMPLIRALMAKAARHAEVAGGNSPLASGAEEYAESDVVPPPSGPLDSLSVRPEGDMRALAQALARTAAARRETERYEPMPESIGGPMDLLQAIRAKLGVPRAMGY